MNLPCTDLREPYYPQQVIGSPAALPLGADIQAPQSLIDNHVTSDSYSSVHVLSYSGYNRTLELMSGAGAEAGTGTGGSGVAIWPEDWNNFLASVDEFMLGNYTC
ncbi:hypothetical protein MPER_15026 [Moniliophthora perniciosa FA553]|nr:hypothetical protein MPER_15026 [Moniliophthora perniciosa FA553]